MLDEISHIPSNETKSHENAIVVVNYSLHVIWRLETSFAIWVLIVICAEYCESHSHPSFVWRG